MFHNEHNESLIVNGNSKAIQSAVAAAEPAGEAEVLVRPSEPLKLTFDLFANHLSCPHCGGECMHHGAVTIYDRKEDAPRVTKIEVRNCSALITRADSEASGNPSDRRHGMAIEFRCEDCEATSKFLIAQHKGQSFVGWRTPYPRHRSRRGAR